MAPQLSLQQKNQNPSIRMRPIILKQFGGYDNLAIENLPDPSLSDVLIVVRAFGTN
jgi:hypothetical protein